MLSLVIVRNLLQSASLRMSVSRFLARVRMREPFDDIPTHKNLLYLFFLLTFVICGVY